MFSSISLAYSKHPVSVYIQYIAGQKSTPKLSLKEQQSLICPGSCSLAGLSQDSSSLLLMMAARMPGSRLEGAFPRWLMEMADGWELNWSCWPEPQLWSPHVASVGFS